MTWPTIAILLATTTACGLDTEAIAPAVDASRLLQRVQLEYRTYNLSLAQPYDTVTLRVQGISGTDAAIDAPVIFAYDTQYVDVRSNGFLTAKRPVDGTLVIATMSYGGATRVDTAVVRIISDAPPSIARVAIEPNPGDSAKIAMPSAAGVRFRKTLRLIREDMNGAPEVALVSVWSSDVAVADIGRPTSAATEAVNVIPARPGRTVFHISTYAYGARLHDSLTFLVGWPLDATVVGQARYASGGSVPVLGLGIGRVRVGVGACVTWRNTSKDVDMDVVFDDPAHVEPADSSFAAGIARCTSYGPQDTTSDGVRNRGNIAAWRATYSSDDALDVFGSSRTRAFPRAGIYTYHSAQHDYEGTVLVCDETHDATCAPENYKWGEAEQ